MDTHQAETVREAEAENGGIRKCDVEKIGSICQHPNDGRKSKNRPTTCVLATDSRRQNETHFAGKRLQDQKEKEGKAVGRAKGEGRRKGRKAKGRMTEG